MSKWALYTDLYLLTMAQGFWKSGNKDEQATFMMYFRDYPFQGGYAIACGMAQLAEIIDDYTFSEDDIAYLATLPAPAGGKLFENDFLDYLSTFKLSVDIDAVHEGTVVFPYEPIVRVQGSIMQCQMLEAALLNCVNFQTLIATKSARVCRAAKGAPVAEFGLRRAQGEGGIWASRAAYVGGCASTSNVLAGEQFDIPVSGTHAHSWVMSFDDELTAFREYVRLFPNNSTLLVDSYDVEQGVKNAIIVAGEMRDRGEKLAAIRIDSGDLAWLAKMSRKMLDGAGLEDVKIVLSNDLDERTVESILDEGAPVDAWGIGTKLITAYDQPTLGGVYKLCAIRKSDQYAWSDRLKVSETAAKTTIPGVVDVRRYTNEDGTLAGDMVFDVNRGVDEDERIVDPLDPLRQKQLKGKKFSTLLHPLARKGESVLSEEFRNAKCAQRRAIAGLKELDDSQLRLLNPHTYPVGLESSLSARRQDLICELRTLR